MTLHDEGSDERAGIPGTVANARLQQLIADLHSLAPEADGPVSPASHVRLMAKVAQLPPPRRGCLERWTRAWPTWPASGVTRAAVAAGLVLALVGAVPQYLQWFQTYVRGAPAGDGASRGPELLSHRTNPGEPLEREGFSLTWEGSPAEDRASRALELLDRGDSPAPPAVGLPALSPLERDAPLGRAPEGGSDRAPGWALAVTVGLVLSVALNLWFGLSRMRQGAGRSRRA
jgi:hypothetical protein